jgi:hypothetical protein
MTEEFLHYIWKYKLLYNDLKTTDNESIVIINPGIHNRDAGPDFFNAKIKIKDTIWAGNIEIHVNASDWHLHNHQNDLAYDNVILHVVFNSNKIILRNNGAPIPQLIINKCFDENIYINYQNFIQNKNWIPCEKLIKDANPFTISNWLEYLLIERLERKTLELQEIFKRNHNSWEDAFYQLLAKNFGFKINSYPFEALAQSLPLTYLGKHKSNENQIAALVFGQAGLLNADLVDDYPQSLFSEYEFLRKKYKLVPLKSHLWKFLRLRPANFPTIRLSQFSDLIYKSSHLFSKILECENLNEIYDLFEVKAHSYFDNHYLFDEKLLIPKQRYLGKSAIDLIVINTIVPMLFFYSESKDEKEYQNRAFSFLENLDAENNSIINKWKQLGINIQSAYDTQGLIELKNNYCTTKRCLNCRIGNELLNKNYNFNESAN